MIFGETKHISKEWNQKSMILEGKYYEAKPAQINQTGGFLLNY